MTEGASRLIAKLATVLNVMQASLAIAWLLLLANSSLPLTNGRKSRSLLDVWSGLGWTNMILVTTQSGVKEFKGASSLGIYLTVLTNQSDIRDVKDRLDSSNLVFNEVKSLENSIVAFLESFPVPYKTMLVVDEDEQEHFENFLANEIVFPAGFFSALHSEEQDITRLYRVQTFGTPGTAAVTEEWKRKEAR